MKIYLISDNRDTLTGMSLVGIEGCIVHTKDELEKELKRVLGESDIGILIIMEKLANEFPDIIDNVRLTRSLPLIVEIPDRHGAGRNPDFITNYIKEAIGVKI